MSKLIIEEFCAAFATNPKDWEFWKGEHKITSDKLIIAGPSRIVGLIDLNKIEEEIEWKAYAIKSEPTKKMCGNFVYEGGMYSIDFLRRAFEFLGESFEVARIREAIMFKLNEDIGLGLAEKITNEDFYYDDEGVMFIESSFEVEKEEWRTVTKAKEFIKWTDNEAKRKHKGHGTNIWWEEVYRWEKFFEEEEDMGDMMLL